MPKPTKSILEIARKEFREKGMIEVPYTLERQCISVGCHIVNLSNLDNKRFFHAGGLENFRTHLVIMGPSGWSKSSMIKFFLSPRLGLLSEAPFPTSVRATFSPESWMGTIRKKKVGDKKVLVATKGVFSRYKRGIVGADEFMRLKVLADSADLATNEETYLLTCLDSDRATKDLSTGSIEETDIGTTLWPGMRITRLNTASGLIRRFTFQLIFPTPDLALRFKQSNRSEQIKQPISEESKLAIAEEIERIWDRIHDVDKFNLKVVEGFLNGSLGVPHFDEIIYKRMAIGYSAAVGSLPVITLDKTLKEIIRDEFIARRIIREVPEKEAMYLVISQYEDGIDRRELFEFFKTYYTMSRAKVKALYLSLATQDKLIYSKGNKVYANIREEDIPPSYKLKH